MRLVFLCLLALAAACRADTNPEEASMQRAAAFFFDKIPELKLHGTTVGESLDVIRQQWQKQHPELPFPVADRENTRPNGEPPHQPRITLTMREIPFAEAIRFVAVQVGKSVVQQAGIFILQPITSLDCDWTIAEYSMKPAALATLGLKSDSSAADICKAFEKLGIESLDQRNLYLRPAEEAPSEGTLLVRATPAGQDQVRGVLLILNAGYQITKPKP